MMTKFKFLLSIKNDILQDCKQSDPKHLFLFPLIDFYGFLRTSKLWLQLDQRIRNNIASYL